MPPLDIDEAGIKWGGGGNPCSCLDLTDKGFLIDVGVCGVLGYSDLCLFDAGPSKSGRS